MKYDIFVSYRRSDRELVASVVRRLEARNIQVWYDAEIEGGADWRETIVDALSNSEMLAIFFSDECNNSRQLKKELAVADSLGKPVVPILIEDTQPRGAYLYELADRNWIQIFPDPMEKIEELVEHLVTLANKPDGGSAGPAAARPSDILKPQANNDVASAPAPANDVVVETEQKLDEAVGEFIAGADQPARPAPKIAKAYVGRVGSDGRPVKKLNDILPFKWIDLIAVVPLLIGLAWLNYQAFIDHGEELPFTLLVAVMMMSLGLAFFGALVFPVRYYLRGRAIGQALVSYLISSAIPFGVALGAFFAAHFAGLNSKDNSPATVVPIYLLVWLGFTVIAFIIYGILAGQRAIRSFRSNIRKI